MKEIYDLTEIVNKQQWMLVFTREHPDEEFTHVWVNDRLLLMDIEKAKDFRWYQGMFGFVLKDGIITMTMGAYLDKEAREKAEKEHLKDGEFFKATYLEDRVTFDPTPLSNYTILKAEPLTPEHIKSFKAFILRQIETKMEEIKSLQKNLGEV